MIKFIMKLFQKKKKLTLDETLKYPDGKRYYKEIHNLRKTMMDEDALKIIHRLNRFGHKSYLVGGCIRDMLLDRKPKDFDVVTTATPNQIKNIFNNCRIIGKRFKIVHILFKNKIIEVSTFRSLPEHRINQKILEEKEEILLKRDNVYGTPKEDAARRDFTVNALYYDPRNESIIDYVGGYEDIKNRILRVIGDPEISFKEDPVRMLRAIKISVLLGLTIEKTTKQGIYEYRFELEKASPSRMLEEYNKIFRTWESAKIFKGLAENYLFEVLFKEVAELDKNYRGQNAAKHFYETKVGQLLQVADRKLKEREELTPPIFYALLFSDIVERKIKTEEGKLVQIIKNALEPICTRIGFPRKEKTRLVKIYASQPRFLKTDEKNKAQNEVFRSKDYFYDAFLYFKILAEVEQNEEALQSAFFWEISTRVRPSKSFHTSNALKKNEQKKLVKNKQQKSKTQQSKEENVFEEGSLDRETSPNEKNDSSTTRNPVEEMDV